MRRRQLFAVCAAVSIPGCGGIPGAGTSSTTQSRTRTDGDSNERLSADDECAPVPDLSITNLTPRSRTVTIVVTAMPERYREASPTPTPVETPSQETPVQTFSDTFDLDAYSPDDQGRDYATAYASVPMETGPRNTERHRLEVDVKEGPETAFPFHPDGQRKGHEVVIGEDGLKVGTSRSHCDV